LLASDHDEQKTKLSYIIFR